ncbi:MAG: hypothetical protein ACRENZ_07070 [Thermodesulfobacteriota bacterium]
MTNEKMAKVDKARSFAEFLKSERHALLNAKAQATLLKLKDKKGRLENPINDSKPLKSLEKKKLESRLRYLNILIRYGKNINREKIGHERIRISNILER